MAKSNMSDAIRGVLNANPDLSTREVVETLAKQKLKVKPNLVYFIKGTMKGKKGPKPQAAAAVSINSDPLVTIRKVKDLAGEVGGMKKLKALVEALGE